MNLLLDVNCVDGEFDDIPLSFRKSLDKSEIDRIIELATMVKDKGLYSVEFFDSDGEWLTDYKDEISSETGTRRVVCTCVLVTERDFKFTGIPKHCPDSCAIYTNTVEIGRISS